MNHNSKNTSAEAETPPEWMQGDTYASLCAAYRQAEQVPEIRAAWAELTNFLTNNIKRENADLRAQLAAATTPVENEEVRNTAKLLRGPVKLEKYINASRTETHDTAIIGALIERLCRQKQAAERALADTLTRLNGALEDALRYRWLRDSGQAVWQDLDGVHWSVGGPKGSNVLASNLDAAIDAARKDAP